MKSNLTRWGIGLYVLVVMFFGSVAILWWMFDLICGNSLSQWYHVLAFFISLLISLSYLYWSVRLLDWIADKLDI